MAKAPRYLWGDTKMDFITLKGRLTTPPGKEGRMFFDNTSGRYKGFRFCVDGTNFDMVTLHN